MSDARGDDARADDVRLHVAARVEARLHAVLARRLRARGWTPRVVPHVGYGADGWVRVLARVLLAPPGRRREQQDARGWRRFLTASASGVPVAVTVGEQTHVVDSARDGYLDVRLPSQLLPGWHVIRLRTGAADPVDVRVRVVAVGPGRGLVSDVDDTVMVTMLPRRLVALRNAFLVKESARRPVPGMAELYAHLVDAHPDLFVVYLSTGAWNTAAALEDFLVRHGYPPGPLLLTDWGPTRTRWFRSGRDHKRRQLCRLFDELPDLRWLLVGDDGQLDPSLYAEAAAAAPEQVLGVAIRRLSTSEQVVRTGTPTARDGTAAGSAAGQVTAADGYGLLRLLRDRGLVEGAGPPPGTG